VRPLYETDADRLAEKNVADLLEVRWTCQLSKLPIAYRLDFLVCTILQPRAFCEIKVRKYTWEQISDWGGYMLSLGKWDAARNLFLATGLPFLLVVSCAGDVRWRLFARFPVVPIKMGGRTDRDDSQDMEPVVMIDCAKFNTL